MKLKETTVYVPKEKFTGYLRGFTKEEKIILSKEQLTELLSSVFYSGQQYERNINQAREADRNGWNFVPVNAKYINELLIELFNTEE